MVRCVTGFAAGQPLGLFDRRAGIYLTALTVASLCLFASVRADEAKAAPLKSGLETNAAGAAATREEQKEQDDEYFELLKLFADAVDQIDRNYVKEVSRRELMEAAVEGLLSKLDPYSSYIPPKDLEQFRSGVESEFGGIGIQVTVDSGHLKIISPLVGTPAYRAGLMAGDRIIKIEGEGTKGITLDDAVKRLKGKVGTKVTFTVMNPDDMSVREVTLEREIVQVRTVLGDHRKTDDSWDYFVDEEQGIGYIRVTAFSRHTAEELKEALDELTEDGMKALVLDLRFNPGGLLSSAIEISDMFISSGRIVSTEGRNTPKRAWEAHKAGTYEGFPMAILVNRFSASASEIVSACLQDHGRAVVIGQRTWGKGSVQNIIELEGGKSALKLTTAGYQRPSGKNIHRFHDAGDDDDWGVKPNKGFEVATTAAQNRHIVEQQRERMIVERHDDSAEEVATDAAEPKVEPDATQSPEPPAIDDGEEDATGTHGDVAGADSSTGSSAVENFVDPQLKRAVDYLLEQLKEGREEGKDEPEQQNPALDAAA